MAAYCASGFSGCQSVWKAEAVEINLKLWICEAVYAYYIREIVADLKWLLQMPFPRNAGSWSARDDILHYKMNSADVISSQWWMIYQMRISTPFLHSCTLICIFLLLLLCHPSSPFRDSILPRLYTTIRYVYLRSPSVPEYRFLYFGTEGVTITPLFEHELMCKLFDFSVNTS